MQVHWICRCTVAVLYALYCFLMSFIDFWTCSINLSCLIFINLFCSWMQVPDQSWSTLVSSSGRHGLLQLFGQFITRLSFLSFIPVCVLQSSVTQRQYKNIINMLSTCPLRLGIMFFTSSMRLWLSGLELEGSRQCRRSLHNLTSWECDIDNIGIDERVDFSDCTIVRMHSKI